MCFCSTILARIVQKTWGGVKICIFLRIFVVTFDCKNFSFSCWRLRTWLPPVPKRWEFVGPFYWTWSLRGVVAVSLVRISGAGVGCPKLCSEKQSSLVHCCGNGIYVLSASPSMTQLYWLSALYGHCSVQANISIFFDKTHRLKNGLRGIFSKIYANGAFIMTS